MAILRQHGAKKHFPWQSLVYTMAMMAGVLGLLTPPAQGQDAQPVDPDQTARIEVDVLGLLTSDQFMLDRVEDGVWEIVPAAGRKLLQVPLIIEPGKQDTEFDNGTVRVGSSRFLAWRVIEPANQEFYDDNESGRPADPNRVAEAARTLEILRTDMPNFTRSFNLTSRGRAQWKMDRFILGGTVKAGDPLSFTRDRLYPYRVSPQLLADTVPKQQRITRSAGEDSNTYYARSAQANNEYRIARESYNELRRQVGELPTEFDIKAPKRIWGVYDILLFERDLKITGTSEGDWQVNLDMLNTLRQAGAARGGANDRLDPRLLSAMAIVARDPHPYSQRLVAYSIAMSGAAWYVTYNDQLYRMMSSILSGSDGVAKRVVISELASVVPPNSATLTLLKNVVTVDMDLRSRMETIKGMLNTDFTTVTTSSRDALNTITLSLNSPQGPPPREILEQILSKTSNNPQAMQNLASGLRFADMPPDRMDQAIIFMVENAGSNPLAAMWLDQQFLGAVNPKVVRRTLDVIASAEGGGQNLTPYVTSALSVLFGKTNQSESEQAAPKTAVLTSPIMIQGTNHALFRALRSSDQQIRMLAWQALPNFIFSPMNTNYQTPEMVNQSNERYQTLLSVALKQSPTPTSAVTFLARQPDKAQSASALIQLVLRGTSDSSAMASHALLAMNAPIEDAVRSLPFGERAGLATRLYENIEAKAPLTVNLLRQRITTNPAVTWFANEIGNGRLPKPSEWAGSVNSDSTLIDLITSSDPDIGLAAVAALVYRAGGSDSDALTLSRKLRGMSDQSSPAITAEWNNAKKAIFVQQFREISGPYKLILKLDTTEYMLAVVQFQSDGTNISFGNQAITLNIPEDRLAILINSPGQIKSLNTMSELANLPLDNAPPIELTRQSTGEWSGIIYAEGITPEPQLIMRSVMVR